MYRRKIDSRIQYQTVESSVTIVQRKLNKQNSVYFLLRFFVSFALRAFGILCFRLSLFSSFTFFLCTFLLSLAIRNASSGDIAICSRSSNKPSTHFSSLESSAEIDSIFSSDFSSYRLER